MLELAVRVDVRVGDRQVVGGRQALLFGAVLGIGLHVLAEHLAGDGGDDLVRRHRAEAADRVPAHREAAVGPQIGVFSAILQGQGVIDADAEEILRRRGSCCRTMAMMSPGRTSRLPRPAAPL